jgi:cytochrome b involved in lipid metabolism
MIKKIVSAVFLIFIVFICGLFVWSLFNGNKPTVGSLTEPAMVAVNDNLRSAPLSAVPAKPIVPVKPVSPTNPTKPIAPSKPSTPIVPIQPTANTVTLSAAEVARHNSAGNCWMIVSGKVYNFTRYIPSHPAGSAMVPYCGRDGTSAFVGKPHSSFAAGLLAGYLLGNLNQTITVSSTSAPPAGVAAPNGGEQEEDDDD